MKKKVLLDLKITCDPPRTWGRLSMEEEAKYYESWVKEFHDFIRDHRSQDPVFLDVERIYQDQCSFCEAVWEIDENGCPVCCNEAVAEWEAEFKKVETSK